MQRLDPNRAALLGAVRGYVRRLRWSDRLVNRTEIHRHAEGKHRPLADYHRLWY